MKMYEKMGLDPTTEEGLTAILTVQCTGIPDNYPKAKCVNEHLSCNECKARRLFAEVSTKKVERYEVYNGDFVKAHNDFVEYCAKNYLISPFLSDFAVWLMEEIEVAE